MTVVGCAGSDAEKILELAGSSVIVMRSKTVIIQLSVNDQNVFVYHVQKSAQVFGSVKSARLKKSGRMRTV